MGSKEDNRNNFPIIAQVIDEFRAIFPNAKVGYAEENGRVVGKEIKTRVIRVVDGTNWCEEISH